MSNPPTSMTWKRPHGKQIEGTPLYILQRKVGYSYNIHLHDPDYSLVALNEVYKHLNENMDCTDTTTDSAFRRAALEHAVNTVTHNVSINRQVMVGREEYYEKYLNMNEDAKGTDARVMEMTEKLTKPLWDDWEWFKKWMMSLVIERVMVREGQRVWMSAMSK
ncbi:hypothetical protein LTR56_015981 [Elasticomyces elasticus]|nr:hypothetical protein LTR22_021244 [Elasticomyces elasticus]KAK3633067.1 hypothetical protein LTR56_015981 [Elasticomyces elasticus]KAK4917941.1 hypothetical protein LTR49_014216 [Elasticomyces elasticus]KAK5753338.1 hypothetical protein LTS12_016581 [Elasticomyces elasticus]